MTELCSHFDVTTLEVFGVGDLAAGLPAAAAALAYVRATQGDRLGHLMRLQRLRPADCMTLDETAVRTLELLEASDGTVRNSLFGVLDETVTPMGARLLRQWLLQPLLDRGAIGARQDAVAALVDAPEARAGLRRAAQAGGRSRAPDQPRHPRRRPRARPRRAARLPGPARRGAPGHGRRWRRRSWPRRARRWPTSTI